MSASSATDYPTWGDTIRATDTFFCPTEWVRQSKPYSWVHARAPEAAKVALTPVAMVDGGLKVAIFPLAAVVGLVVFPIFAMINGGMAAVHEAKGNQEKAAKCHGRASLGWKMTVISLGACAGLITFVCLSVYVLPIWMPVAALFAAVGGSVFITVYRVWHHTPWGLEARAKPQIEQSSGQDPSTVEVDS